MVYTPDLMTRIAKFYRVSVTGQPGEYRGVVTHKTSGKSLTVDVTCGTESGAVMAARAHLVGAVKKGTLPLA
jgi:ABC-type antimicrobial peptide transport system ATPase subunit